MNFKLVIAGLAVAAAAPAKVKVGVYEEAF